MARSYELLSRENWTESSLAELVRTELAPFGPERLTIEGPDVSLKPKLALSLGMVLHELATNAGKYGALSVPPGKLAIHWSGPGRKAHATWISSGSNPNGPRARKAPHRASA